MEEIEKIISAITEITGLDGWSIKFGKTDECKQARDILCYIALKDRYGLTWNLMELLSYRKSQVYFSADRCKERMEEDLSFLKVMNEVRKKLSLAPIFNDKAEQMKEKERQKERRQSRIRSNENSKRIFGIEYSKAEEKRLLQTMLDAKEFMRKYSKIGRKADGRITRTHY